MAQANYNAYAKYIELRNSGMNPFEALRQAFPEGMMSPEERAKRAAGQDQSSALGQMAGLGVGVIGAKALQDALAGERVLGGLRDSIFGASTAAPVAATGAGAASTGAAGAAGLGATAAAPTAGGLAASTPVAPSIGGGQILADGTIVGDATNISNFAGAATPYLGAGATALGAYSALQGIKKKDPLSAGLGGLGVAGGLGMMGYAIPGWGQAAMVGVPLVAALAGKMGDKDRWKTEQKRLNKLREQGINIPQMGADALTGGRSKKELIAIEEQKAAQGLPSNVEFARTRDEKYLKPEDIWGYSAFFDKYGNDWLSKFSEQQRRDIAQQALNAGAVSEQRGTIDIDWSKVPQPQQQQSQRKKG
jgi:hypothetical protein